MAEFDGSGSGETRAHPREQLYNRKKRKRLTGLNKITDVICINAAYVIKDYFKLKNFR